MTATIDPDYFPHIIDRIIDFCPRNSRNVIRATSRTFRDRIDSSDVRHLEFGNPRQLFDDTLSFSIGPPLSRIPCISRLIVHNNGVVKVESGDRPMPKWVVERILDTIDKHTKIVDILSSPGAELGCFRFSNLDVLCIHSVGRQPPAFLWNPRTLVLFARRPAGTHWSPFGGREEVVVRRELPSRTRKLVLNNVGSTTTPLDYWSFIILPEQQVDIVVVFPLYKLHSRSGSFPFWSPRHGRLGYAIGDLTYRAPHCSITLVGLNEIAADFHKRFLRLLEDGIEDAMLDDDTANTNTRAAITTLLSNFFFMSMDKYAAAVDDEERVSLETVQIIDSLSSLLYHCGRSG